MSHQNPQYPQHGYQPPIAQHGAPPGYAPPLPPAPPPSPPAYDASPSQAPAPAAAPVSDMVQYSMPADDDYQEGGGQQGPEKPILRIGGKKPTYPGVFTFDLRPLPVARDAFAAASDPPPRAKIKVERHFFQLPNGKYYIENCPIAMRVPGARCLVCEKAQEYAAGNPIDSDHVKKMKARTIVFMWVINRADPARGPMIHEGHWSFDKMYATLTKQGVNPFDPIGGLDITVQAPRPNSGERWEYRHAVRSTPAAALPNGQPDHALINEWISKTYDLIAEATCISYEDQLAKYNKLLSSGGGQSGPPGGGYAATHNVPAYAPPGYPSQPPPGYGQPQPPYGQPPGYPQQAPPPGYAPPMGPPPLQQPGYPPQHAATPPGYGPPPGYPQQR